MRLALALLVLLVAPRARAHDHFLSPDVLIADAPADVSVAHLVGEDFTRLEERAAEPAAATRFALLSGDADAIDLRARIAPGTKPAIAVSLGVGAHLLVLDRKEVDITLPPAKFEAYLREEGLSAIVAARAARGEATREGRERYVRCLKALVRIGAASDPMAGTRVIGQRLEIVPEHDPTDPTVSVIPVRLALHGVPVVGHPITVHRRSGGTLHTTQLVTDESGRVVLPLSNGAFLLRTVFMERCLGCEGADWSSAWAAYTFGRGSGTVRMPSLSLERPVRRSRRGLLFALFVGFTAAALFTCASRRSLGADS